MRMRSMLHPGPRGAVHARGNYRLQTSAVLTAAVRGSACIIPVVEMAVRLAHSLFGSGGGGLTPAVILHGLFGSGNNWRAIASKLASETNRLVQFVNFSKLLIYQLC